MLCEKCGYALWNLPSGRCPECGEPFTPSQFHFRPGKVNFLCPHCRQPYFASAPDGQPTREPFPCTKCGQVVDPDAMPVVPAPGVPEEQALAERTPWVDRRHLGLWRAFWRTVGLSLVQPARVVRRLPPQGGVGEALRFAYAVALFVAAISFCMSAIFWGGMYLLMQSQQGGPAGPVGPVWPMLASFGFGALATLLWPIVGVGLWALCTHALLAITGKRVGGLALTYRTMLYGQGPLVLQAAPVCGSYVAWVWLSVSSIVMLKTSQGVHGLRATIAVLAPPLLVAGAFVGLVVWAISSVWGAGGFSGAPFNTTPVGLGLMAQASAADGSGPDHIFELVADGTLSMRDIVDPREEFEAWQEIRVGEWTAGELDSMPQDELLAIAERLPESRDPQQTWYRVNDMVFCYEGLDLRLSAGSESRIVAFAYDAISEIGSVFYSDGVAEYYDFDLSRTLKQENERRRALGLPLVPTVDEAYGNDE